MSIIQFENGTQVNFDGNPTPEDVDFVAKQVGVGQKSPLSIDLGWDQFQGKVNDAKNAGINQMKEGWNQAMSAGTNPLPMAEGMANATAGAVNTVTSPLAPFFEPIVSGIKGTVDYLNNIPNKLTGKPDQDITDNPLLQQFAMSPAGEATSRVTKDVQNIDTIAGAVAGGEGVAKGKLASPTEEFTGPTVSPEEPPAAALKATQEQVAKQKIIEDSIRNTTDLYGMPRNLLYNMENRNGTSPLETISSYGEKAIPAIEPGRGVVNPLAAIDFLNERISDLSNLKGEAIELSNEPTRVQEIQQKVNDIIQQQGWTKLQSDRALAKIGSYEKNLVEPTGTGSGEIGDLRNSYPDGSIPLSEIDRLKTYESKLSNSYNNRTAGPFELDAHGILGKALRQIVEDKTQSDVIREFNKHIQSHYDAIELLKSLENKTPHGGMLTKQFQRVASEGVGVGIGTILGGHPIAGAVIGRMANDTLMGIFNDHFISNPLKRMLIKNMTDIPDPVIKRMLDYIDRTKGKKAQLLLAAPKPGALRSSVGSGRTIPVVPNRSIELPNEKLVAGSYKATEAPTGKAKGVPVEKMAGEQYPQELPIIKMGRREKTGSNLPKAKGLPKVYSPQNNRQSSIPKNAERTAPTASTNKTAKTIPSKANMKSIIPRKNK